MSEELKAILEQIEALDELKQATLKSYISKAKEDKRELDSAAKKAGAAEDEGTESLLQNKKEKRQAGIENAQSRTFGKKAVDEAVIYIQHKDSNGNVHVLSSSGKHVALNKGTSSLANVMHSAPGHAGSGTTEKSSVLNTAIKSAHDKGKDAVLSAAKKTTGLDWKHHSVTESTELDEAAEDTSTNDLGLDKFSQDALVKHKAKLKREKNDFAMTNKLNQKPVAEGLEGLEDIIEQIEALDEVSKKELAACMDQDEDDKGIEDKEDAKKIKMKESVEALVSAILDDGDASAAFNTAMAEKVTGVMDAMKVDIASQLTK